MDILCIVILRMCDRKNRRKQKNPTRHNNPKDSDSDNDLIKQIFGIVDGNSETEEEREPEQFCNNPTCNHIESTKRQRIEQKEIESLDDLIQLAKMFHCKNNKQYFGINLRVLYNLIEPLSELKNLIGMKKVKDNIVNQILFFLQGFNDKKCGECIDCKNDIVCLKSQNTDMMHTVITGPPGVGKTELGKIMGHIYKNMGILSNGDMKIVSRNDLIGKYLGHTANKTQKMIDSCEGGVMFIDEAYSLGNPEGRDSFSKECLDTLNQNLTDKRNFLCIIAGYKKSLENCFFAYNEGLRRRFSFRYDIEKYNAEELRDIFIYKVKQEEWYICDGNMEQLTKFFKNNHKLFPNYGGDIETLILNCKIAHGRRALFREKNMRKYLSYEDIESGLKRFLTERKPVENNVPEGMYI